MNRRAALTLAATTAAAVASVIAVGTGALAAFTDSETNPQTITAAAQFPGIGPDVKAQSLNSAPAATNEISLGLQVENTGDSALDLRKVTLRYWFTNDYGTTGVDSRCNFVPPPLNCGAVTRSTGLVEPARVGGDRYLELGFSTGSLAPGAKTGSMQIQIFRIGGGGPFNQADDYSHTTRTSLGDAPNVTVYVAGTLAWGTEPPSRAVAPGLRVRYTDLDGNPTNDRMAPGLILDNTGTGQVNLNQVMMRYWFTQNPKSASFQIFCDAAAVGCGTITRQVDKVTPKRPGADQVLEVGFTGQTLPAGSSTGEIRLRVNLSNFAALDESDDYSHGSTGPFVEWRKVTAYLDGQLLWGTEP